MNLISRDFLIDGRDQDFSPLAAQMVEVMRLIYDPEIPVPIWDLGLIYGWDVEETAEGADVTIRMTLTAPNCPAAETLPAEVEGGVNALEGVRRVRLDLVFTPTYSMEMMSEEAKLTLGFM
jgi:FeS assembly SUF system protein